MKAEDFLKNLGFPNQAIVNNGSGSDWDLLSILDRYLSINEPKDFDSASRVMIKYLAENHHPHTTAIITSTGCEILEGVKSTGQLMDYIKD